MEIVFILTYLSNTIENGIDPLTEKNSLAKNLLFSSGLYFVVSIIGILVFSLLAGGITVATGT